jgi:hypothetical protein
VGMAKGETSIHETPLSHQSPLPFFSEIENAISPDLDWSELPKEGRIMLERKGVDVANRQTWGDLQNWLIDKLELFSNVFRPIVKSLDAADYEAPELTP